MRMLRNLRSSLVAFLLFLAAPMLIAAAGHPPSDFFGNGTSDLLWRNTTTGQVYLMPMSGGQTQPGAFIWTEPNMGWQILGTGDFDGDGKADILWRNNTTGQVCLMLMNGTTVKSSSIVYTEPNTAWTIQAGADFHGNGMTDLLWRNSTTGQVYLMPMNGSTVLPGAVVWTEPDPAWQIVATGDFDSDGKADILWWNRTTGQVCVMLMNGASVKSSSIIYTEPNTAWQIVGKGDFNGDGKADILWRNGTTGQVYVMLMNGTSVLSGAVIWTEPDLAWQITTIGDFNGDGRSDIVWHNSSTGQVFEMLMNGLNIGSSGIIHTEPDTAWILEGQAHSVTSGITRQWTWVGGSNLVGRAGNYGTKGVGAASNAPGGRYAGVSGADINGNLWLFGGWGYDSGGTGAYLGDLWKFDGTNWTWVSGSNIGAQAGNYGTKGVAAASNAPGARDSSACWTDHNGNFWIFGGSGYDSAGHFDALNDLWKFDGTYWTWVSGSSIIDQTGIYGTKGVAAATNVPGWRKDSVSWTDSQNNLWLFGGAGADSTGAGAVYILNDLWKFDGTNWTWVSGSNFVDQSGIYGTKGVAAAANVPGARSLAVSWIDSQDHLWLFGGSGHGGDFSDLWKFDGTSWTWVSGPNTMDHVGSYGTKGTSAATNVPGARWGAVSWMDGSGNLWLFGGAGEGSTLSAGVWLNDLWKFDGTQWTWISGDPLGGQTGVYGNKNTAAAANTPGGRTNLVSWVDRNGNLVLFGGEGIDSTGAWGYGLNDLWRFKP